MSKVKKKVFVNVTFEQAQEASEMFASKNTELAALEAKLNEEINTVKSKYQDEITELQKALEEPVEILHVYGNEQCKNWKGKSTELLHCIIGFRTGTPKVDKKKGFTWEAVLELMKKSSIFKPYIRTVDEIDKEAILALKENDSVLGKLKEDCFIKIVQDETFYVKAKQEQLVQN